MNDRPDPGTPDNELAAGALPSASDQSIPMLTDVLHLPRYAGSELPATLAEVSWSDLSLRVQENVTERLMRRSEVMLATQLKETLDAVLDRHIHSLQTDLSDSLSRMIRDLVARAVADELARVHNEITSRKPGVDKATPPA